MRSTERGRPSHGRNALHTTGPTAPEWSYRGATMVELTSAPCALVPTPQTTGASRMEFFARPRTAVVRKRITALLPPSRNLCRFHLLRA